MWPWREVGVEEKERVAHIREAWYNDAVVGFSGAGSRGGAFVY